MLLTVTDEDALLDEVPVDEDPFQFDASQIHLSKVFHMNILKHHFKLMKYILPREFLTID